MNQSPSGQKTFPCPQCGAQLQWDPTKAQAACPYCGHVQQMDAGPAGVQQQARQAAAIQEHDLYAFLAQSSQKKPHGYGAATKMVKCNTCGASISIESHISSTECSFCGSNMVFEQPEDQSIVQPESLIPLQIDKTTAMKHYKDWLGAGWFRPGDLKKRAGQARLYGVYLPFWTFDANVHSDWSAEAGYYYYENETYWETDSSGQQVQKTRQVRKTRWEPAYGTHDAFYDDVLIYATQSVQPKLLERVYPYDMTKLVPYDARYLSGWGAEHYQVDLAQGWQMGQEKIHSMEYGECDSLVPGDTHRNLSVSCTCSNVTFKHVLLPLWISSYMYKKKLLRFLVNGQTGKIHGEKPISWAKVMIAIIFGLILLSIIAGLVYYFMQ